MPVVLRLGPYRFFFYSRENNEPAHIHVASGEKEAKVWIATVRLANSYGFRPHEIKIVLRLVEENQGTFMEAWNEHFGNNA